MTTLYIDIETYSTTDIKRGVYRYSEDPEFLVLMAAWAIDDDPTQVAIGHEEIAAIPHLLDGSDVVRVAHNAQFERVCLSRLAALPVGSYLPPEAWEDTMALMAEWGYPQSLEEGAKALGAEPKDGAGKDLIRWFCQPARNGKRRLPEDHPEKWAAFVEYCRQDVDTMRDMHKRLLAKHGAWPTEQERQVWIADQKVNDRGITVDLELAAHAVEAASANTEEAKAEARAITGLENPNSPAQLLAWFGGLVPDLKADTVRDALARDDLTADQRRVLELRQGMALTAHKKFQVALDAASPDGRLRGGFRFFGAHTGRWAGRGLQFQNMPRDGFASEVEQDAALLDLRLGLGADPHTLKALVRPMLVGPFTVCDYSAIEARVVAWLAGESWALEAFAEGRDIYVETANRMGGGMGRKEGKVAVLALGYNGGVGSLRAMGGDALGGEAVLQRIVDQWRGANRNIVRLWGRLERAFYYGGQAGDRLTVEADGSDRLVRLPSGRAVVYHQVRAGRDGRLSFQDPKLRWRTETYGGRLVENVTQAVARDVLGTALVRLVEEGHLVVGHVHDEVIVESSPESSLEAIRRVLVTPTEWSEGLPLAAAGYSCGRYRKD
jgi:DNA-dependent DNA polymerase, family A|nr:MAG TPA: DNA polymerase I [Caudoviricetes sp.]